MQGLFIRMPSRDGVSWNTVIDGHSSHGTCEDSVRFYRLMLKEGVKNLNRITFSTMLILSLRRDNVNLGRQIHGQILRFGFESYAFVGSPLMNMYSNAGLICDALQVFQEMPEKNMVACNTMITGFLRCGKIIESDQLFHHMIEKDSITWSTMIAGLIKNGLKRQAVDVFREMRLEGVAMDQFTFGSVLRACGSLLALEEGKQIHAYIIRTNYKDHLFVGSALIDMYSKCGSTNYAERVFVRMTCRNVISWTTMLMGFSQNGYNEKAIHFFCKMQMDGPEPDEYTLGCVIRSCANLACLEEGVQFHCQAQVSGLISFITVSNALVTLYSKCGSVEDSNRLFNEMKATDEVSWTAIMSGYAQFGKANETFALFERMLSNGLQPDGVTFIGVLSACSRAGLVEKGRRYFESMVQEHGIVPNTNHYTCMIDLLSRAGKLEEARSFIIEKMPCRPDEFCWVTLLSSCRFYGNVEIGKWAADSLLELAPQNPAGYILLSSIYAAKGKWDNVANIRMEMRKNGVRKEPGCSWIKYNGKVHIFSADDQSNWFSGQIYAELEKLYSEMIKQGYVPDIASVHHDVVESEKMEMLHHHSEKLAIAFGLIFLPPGLPIRVFKNLRVCGDCHNATKFISKITQREILVRDAARFHLFKNGTCSCGDFW